MGVRNSLFAFDFAAMDLEFMDGRKASALELSALALDDHLIAFDESGSFVSLILLLYQQFNKEAKPQVTCAFTCLE
jgi:hypothetical protein